MISTFSYIKQLDMQYSTMIIHDWKSALGRGCPDQKKAAYVLNILMHLQSAVTLLSRNTYECDLTTTVSHGMLRQYILCEPCIMRW